MYVMIGNDASISAASFFFFDRLPLAGVFEVGTVFVGVYKIIDVWVLGCASLIGEGKACLFSPVDEWAGEARMEAE